MKYLFRNPAFLLLFCISFGNAANFKTESIVSARCNPYNKVRLLIIDGSVSEFSIGEKVEFKVDALVCPEPVKKWEDGILYAYTRSFEEDGIFSCKIVKKGKNYLLVESCWQRHPDSFMYHDVSAEERKSYMILQTTSPKDFYEGGSFYIKGTKYSNGDRHIAGTTVQWERITTEGQKTYFIDQNIRIEKSEIRSMECNVAEVNDTDDYTLVDDCKWAFHHYSYSLNDETLQDSYSGYRKYRKNGTLLFEGSIYVDSQTGSVTVDGMCYSSNGMKQTKRVNKLSACK